MYLTKEMVCNTILKIDSFKLKLENLYEEYDIDINENTGRRNALISSIQEKVLAEELGKTYADVINDGAPGMPDIVIGETGTELECKLTSGSGKKSRSYSLQTDYATICNKKSLDYVYFVTNQDMTGYCVVYFQGLTPDDFYEPPESARGKAKMNKKLGMLKATSIVGGVKNINDGYVESYLEKANDAKEAWNSFENNHLLSVEDYLIKGRMDRFVIAHQKEKERLNKKVVKNTNKAKLWQKKDPSFSFIFEHIDNIIKGDKNDKS